MLPVRKCHGICFTDDSQVVLFEHVGGYVSIPGGTIEPDETPEQALVREVREESGAVVRSFGLFAYLIDVNRASNETIVQLRYWVNVSLSDFGPNDPDKKALQRVVVPFDQAAEKLGWGRRAELLLEYAAQARKSSLEL